MSSIDNHIKAKYIIPFLLIFIGLSYFVAQFSFPLIGDDLVYAGKWEELSAERGWLAYPTALYRQWVTTNARMADMLNPIVLGMLPMWLVHVINSCVVVLLLWLVIRLSDCKNRGNIFQVSIVWLMVFTLPWWDSLMLQVCWHNYVWSATFGLLSIYIFLHLNDNKNRERDLIFICCFAMLSMAMHEGEGMALCVGLMTYIYKVRGWRNLNKRERVMAVCIALSAIFVVSSPASWSRLGNVSEMANKRGAIEILLSSNFYLLLLVVVLSLMLVSAQGRGMLRRKLHSDWIIFAVAAMVSAFFSVISGIVGRTGFFAQIFSLIAIFKLLADIECKASKVKSHDMLRRLMIVLMSLTIMTHFISFAFYQYRAGAELQIVKSDYVKSNDGLVYIDYLRDTDVPWWVMQKVEGVPDSDDVWILHTISQLDSVGGKRLVILPAEFKDVESDKLQSPMMIGRDLISPYSPAATEELTTFENIDLLRMYANVSSVGDSIYIDYNKSGQEWIVKPFRKGNRELYLISERYIDWGD